MKLTHTLMVLGALVSTASAQPTYNISGFGTFAASTESNESGYLENGDGDLDVKSDSLLAIQLDATINDRVSFQGQLLSEGVNDWDVELDLANISYLVGNGFSVRAGKLRLPLFYYSDYLNTRYSHPWVRPPQETYDLVPVSNYDGVTVMYETSVGDYQYVGQIFGGEAGFSLAASEADLENAIGIANVFEGLNQTFRFSYMSSNLVGNIGIPAFGLDLVLDERSTFLGLGYLYDNGSVMALAEYTNADVGELIETIETYYVTLGYRFGDFTPYITYAHLDQESTFSAADPLTSLLLNSTFNSTRTTYSIGTRYDVSTGIALKAEYSYVTDLDGTTGALGNNLNPVIGPMGQFLGFDSPYDSVSVFTVSVDFIF